MQRFWSHVIFRLSDKFVRLVFRYSRAIVATLLLITFLCAFRAAFTPINGDMVRCFVDDLQAIEKHLEQSATFGDDSGKLLVVVADEGEQLFTVKKLKAIRAAKNKIQEIVEVKSVTTFVDAFREKLPRQSLRTVLKKNAVRSGLLQGRVPEKNVKPPRYWPLSVRKQAKTDLVEMRESALVDERVVRNSLSEDGTKHSFLITMDPALELSLPRQQEFCLQIQNILAEHNVGTNGVYMAGVPVANAAMGAEIQTAFFKLLPFGFVAVAFIVFSIYRDIRVTFLSVVIGGIAVIWALGITSLLYGEITLLVAAMPIVVLAVSTTDFLHITTAWQLAAHDSDQSKEHTLVAVFQEVGGACVLTSITTFIGFASLILTHSAAVRQFGFACATGTSVALLLMVTLLPIAFRRMKPLNSEVEKNLVYRAVDLLLESCKSLVRRSPGTVFAFSLLLCIPGLWVIVGKPIDADLPRRFPKEHPLRQSVEVIESDFTGASSVELYVTGSSEQLLSHETSLKLREFEDELKSHLSVLSVISILDLFRGIDDSISYFTDDGLPPDVASASASVDWSSRIDPRLVESLITDGKDQFRIRVMTRSSGFRETHRLSQNFEILLKEKLGPDFTVSVGGTYPLVGSALAKIVNSQMFGFVFCMLSLTAVMVWGLGEWRVAVLAQIPNLIPVLLMVGVVAFSLDRIDSDLLGLPMIALGIAVDDTIHFLNRYRLAILENPDSDAAIASVFKTTGRSITISTLVLCIGLMPLAFAQIIGLWMLGTFLVLGVLGALVADLLCLPAMIRLGIIKFRAV